MRTNGAARVGRRDGVNRHDSSRPLGISKASASLMTTVLMGKTLAEAEKAFEDFHELVTSSTTDEIDVEEMGKLAVFSGVREFPARVKCASLAWHTVHAALAAADEPVSTE